MDKSVSNTYKGRRSYDNSVVGGSREQWVVTGHACLLDKCLIGVHQSGFKRPVIVVGKSKLNQFESTISPYTSKELLIFGLRLLSCMVDVGG